VLQSMMGWDVHQEALFSKFLLEHHVRQTHPLRAIDRFPDSDLLRRAFETVLQRNIEEGLDRGDGFAANASLIVADASDRRVEGATGLPRDVVGHAVKEYLAVLDERCRVRCRN
jgi:hypothetical protein